MTAKEACQEDLFVCCIFPVNQSLWLALSIPPMYRIRKAIQDDGRASLYAGQSDLFVGLDLSCGVCGQ